VGGWVRTCREGAWGSSGKVCGFVEGVLSYTHNYNSKSITHALSASILVYDFLYYMGWNYLY